MKFHVYSWNAIWSLNLRIPQHNGQFAASGRLSPQISGLLRSYYRIGQEVDFLVKHHAWWPAEGKHSTAQIIARTAEATRAGCRELARSALDLLIRISRPRRGSLALVLLHAWAWLEKLFWGARGRSAGKEGKKKLFRPQKSFIFYRQRPVSRQGRKKNFSGPKKFYFLSPEAGQKARKEKKTFQDPKKFYFLSPEAGQQARKEQNLFRPQKVLYFYR